MHIWVFCTCTDLLLHGHPSSTDEGLPLLITGAADDLGLEDLVHGLLDLRLGGALDVAQQLQYGKVACFLFFFFFCFKPSGALTLGCKTNKPKKKSRPGGSGRSRSQGWTEGGPPPPSTPAPPPEGWPPWSACSRPSRGGRCCGRSANPRFLNDKLLLFFFCAFKKNLLELALLRLVLLAFLFMILIKWTKKELNERTHPQKIKKNKAAPDSRQ